MLVMVLVFAAAANALSASIQPPRMVLRGNVSDVVTAFVDTRNPNEIPVSVNVTVVDLSNLNIDGPAIFELAPNETKRVVFNVVLEKPGTHTGELQFIFYPAERTEKIERGVALGSQIVTVVEGEAVASTTSTTTTTVPTDIPNPEFVNTVLAAAAVVTAIVLFMYIRGR